MFGRRPSATTERREFEEIRLILRELSDAPSLEVRDIKWLAGRLVATGVPWSQIEVQRGNIAPSVIGAKEWSSLARWHDKLQVTGH